ncbi:hypothetical protein BDA99DRAFT_541304 [Phascolomyces articulosus]|uniref:N-acetyltransferase domain-containing protein n=1 Tax=Phascolomyces articulosus TaxID=60185 RepID=A0AAD5P9X3_9FUNG|nr:hypothetical protein BDA99DRAFT_541304 [Phascolomyces articulosus]
MAFTIRSSVNSEEVSSILYPWVEKENWDPGFDGKDIQCAYYPSDPKSFFFGTLPQEQQDNKDDKKKDRVVSSICAIQHDDNTGYIAFYVVEPSHRKNGYGLKTFNHALQHLSTCPWIGLDAVEAQMETYKKSGFVVQTPSKRYVGGIQYHIKTMAASPETTSGDTVVDLTSVAIDKLIQQDHRYTDMHRPTFVSHWVEYHIKHAYGLALVDPKNPEQVTGFGCMRRCASGTYRIAPLYADTPDHAFDLAIRLTAMVKEEDAQFAVDAWLATDAPKVLFEDKFGWKSISTMYRMWRKGASTEQDTQPPLGLSNGFFAIASPEVG